MYTITFRLALMYTDCMVQIYITMRNYVQKTESVNNFNNMSNSYEIKDLA